MSLCFALRWFEMLREGGKSTSKLLRALLPYVTGSGGQLAGH